MPDNLTNPQDPDNLTNPQDSKIPEKLRDIVINESDLLIQTQYQMQEIDSNKYHGRDKERGFGWIPLYESIKGYVDWIELYEAASGDNKNPNLKFIKNDSERNMLHEKEKSKAKKAIEIFNKKHKIGAENNFHPPVMGVPPMDFMIPEPVIVKLTPQDEEEQRLLNDNLEQINNKNSNEIYQDLKKNGRVLVPFKTQNDKHNTYILIEEIDGNNSEKEYKCTLYEGGGGTIQLQEKLINEEQKKRLKKAHGTDYDYGVYAGMTYKLNPKQIKVQDFIKEQVAGNYKNTNLAEIPGISFSENLEKITQGQVNSNCVTYGLALATKDILKDSTSSHLKSSLNPTKTLEDFFSFTRDTKITDLQTLVNVEDHEMIGNNPRQLRQFDQRKANTPETKKMLFNREKESFKNGFNNSLDPVLVDKLYDKTFAVVNDRNVPINQLTFDKTSWPLREIIIAKGGQLTNDNFNEILTTWHEKILGPQDIGKVSSVTKASVEIASQEPREVKEVNLAPTAKFRTPGEEVPSTISKISTKLPTVYDINNEILSPSNIKREIGIEKIREETIEQEKKRSPYKQPLSTQLKYEDVVKEITKNREGKIIKTDTQLKQEGDQYLKEQQTKAMQGIPLHDKEAELTRERIPLNTKLAEHYDSVNKVPLPPKRVMESQANAPRPDTRNELKSHIYKTQITENPRNPAT